MSNEPQSIDLSRETEALRRFARGVLLEPALADDAVQEAWLAALRQPTAELSSGWLREAVRRIARGLRRREARVSAREHAAASAEAVPSSLETVARLEVLRELVAALEQLPEPYRTAVRLRYLDDLPPREIARRCGVPVETARTHVKRGIERLRARLDVEHRGGRGSLLAALLPLAGFESAQSFAFAASATSGKSILLGIMGSKLQVAALIVFVLSAGWWWAERGGGPAAQQVSAVDLDAGTIAGVGHAEPAATFAPAEFHGIGGPEREAQSRRLATARGDWVVRGQVLRGQSEPFPNASLRLKLITGYEGTGETLCDELVQADAQGAFELALPAPSLGVRISLRSAMENVIGFEQEQIVRRGTSAPQDLSLRLYPLDVVLRGRVLDADGAAIPGATAQTRGVPASCAADGSFEVRHSSFLTQVGVEARAAGFAAKQVVLAVQGPGTLEGIELRLTRGVRLHGRVIDEQGSPVPAAEISAHAEVLSTTTSDAQGHFEFDSLPREGRWVSLFAGAPGFAKLRHDFEDGRYPKSGVELVLRRGIDIPGVLLDEHGAASAAAFVFTNEALWDELASIAVTDDEGRFLLHDVARGSNRVGTQVEGFEPLSRSLELPQQGPFVGELRLELRRGIELHGRVLDPHGVAVSKAAVFVRQGGDYIENARTDSDAEGRFTLKGLPLNVELQIEVVAVGFVRLAQPIDPLRGGEQRFVLAPAAGLAGRVIDAATGAALTQFSVRLTSAQLEPGEVPLSGYDAVWIEGGKEFHDAAGKWSTQGESLSAGAITALEISAPGYGPAIVLRAVACLDPRSQPIVVALGQAARVSGRVLDARDGSAIVGAKIVRFVAQDALGPWYPRSSGGRVETITDTAGDFQLDGLPTIAMSLFIERAGFAAAFDGPFEVSPTTAPRQIAMQQGARIVGVLSDAAGRRLAGEHVQLWTRSVEREENRDFKTRSDAQGAFAFEDLNLGRYDLAVAVTYSTGRIYDLGQSVELTQLGDHEVELRPRGDCAIVGRLTFAKELPHECRVFATRWSSPGTPEAALRATIAIDGRFELRGLEAGRWELRFGNDPWSSKSPTVVELAAQREESVVVELP